MKQWIWLCTYIGETFSCFLFCRNKTVLAEIKDSIVAFCERTEKLVRMKKKLNFQFFLFFVFLQYCTIRPLFKNH